MTRASNALLHTSLNTAFKRQNAADDVVVDTPSLVTAMTATQSGATTMNLAWTVAVGTPANAVASVYRAPAAGAPAAAANAFTDAGDLVAVVAHGLLNDDRVVFPTVVTTTGITANTNYWVVNKTDDNFQVADTQGGAAKVLTTDGTGTFLKVNAVLTDTGDTVTKIAHGYLNGQRLMFTKIVGTTGIVINTSYYVVQRTVDTYKLSETVGGSALPLTTNGVGVVFVPTFTYTWVANVLASANAYSATGLTTNTEYQWKVAVSNLTENAGTLAFDTTA